MAEVLGVASSITGLVGIAELLVGKGFKFIKFIKDTKEAKDSVKKLVHEVNLLSGVLYCLGNVVRGLEDDSPANYYMQIHHIESCYQTLSKVQEVFEKALPSKSLSKTEKLKWPLKESKTKELLLEVERHKATMTLALSAQEMSTLLELLARQNSVQQTLRSLGVSFEEDRRERKQIVIDEESKKMLDFLSKVDARQWQDFNIQLRQPGTGVWFTDGNEFKMWLSSKVSKLWINGIAGAGKTILVASTIQELQKLCNASSKTALVFFYCDYKNDTTHKLCNILGSLARQLTAQDQACFADLKIFYDSYITNDHANRVPTAHDLSGLIKKLIRHFETVMIVVDGLDEISNDRANVTRHLRNLNTPSENVKTLFASRLEVDLGYELEDFPQISIAAKSTDLKLYVSSEIERRMKERKLRIRDKDLKEYIMKTLVEQADGMFRWVACQLDYLCECSNDLERREALQKLPPDLPSSYERILERLNKTTKQNQLMVRNTLHWLAHAQPSYHPTTQRLLQYLAAYDGREHFDSRAMTTEEELLDWCSSLVRKSSNMCCLEFAHFTVKEFLLSIDPLKRPEFLYYQLSNDHTILAESCIRFLTCASFDGEIGPVFREISDEDNEISFDKKIQKGVYSTVSESSVVEEEKLGQIKSVYDEEFGSKYDTFYRNSFKPFDEKYLFFRYACDNWSYHVHRSNYPAVKDLVLSLLSSNPQIFHRWTFTWMICNNYDSREGEILYRSSMDTSALDWAACFALDDACKSIIEAGADVNKISPFGTPLRFAILASSFQFPDDENYWHTPESYLANEKLYSTSRLNVIGYLLASGAQYASDSRSLRQYSLLEIGINVDKDLHQPFITSILLDFGFKLSASEVSSYVSNSSYHPRTSSSEFYRNEFWEIGSYIRHTTRIYIPMEHVSRSPAKYLERAAYAHYYEYFLRVLFLGCPVSELVPRLNFDQEIFTATQLSVLYGIMQTKPRLSPKIVIRALCTAITYCAISDAQAKYIFQNSLITAVMCPQDLTVLCLRELLQELDESYKGHEKREDMVFHEVIEDVQAHFRIRGILLGLYNHPSSIIAIVEYFALAVIRKYFEKHCWIAEAGSIYPAPWIQEPLQDILAHILTSSDEIFKQSVLQAFADIKNTRWIVTDFLILVDPDFSLLKHLQGENLDFGNRYEGERTLLHLATSTAIPATTFEFLVKESQLLADQDHNGESASHLLSTTSDDLSMRKLKCLLDHIPTFEAHNTINQRNMNLWTPLAFAILSNSIPAMNLLLEAGADIKLKYSYGETVLHVACWVGNGKAALALLKRGASIRDKDNYNQTPIDVALACNHTALADILQDLSKLFDINVAPTLPCESQDDMCLTIRASDAEQDSHDKLPAHLAYLELFRS